MEELNTALATLIEQATTGIDASVSFLQAELPDVIYQLLLWHSIRSAIFCILAVVVLLLIIITYPKAQRKMCGDEPFFPNHPEVMILWIVYIFPAVFVLQSLNLTWLQICIAPKVWLLEYAAKLVS